MSTDGSKEMGLFVKTLSIPLNAEATAADLLYKIMQLMMKDVGNRDISGTLAKALKHQDATVIEVNNYGEARDLLRKFEANGIYYAAQVSMRVDGQDKVGIVIMNQDRQQALAVTDSFYAERFGGLCSVEILQDYANGKLVEIKNQSSEETNLFITRCKENHIPISIEGPGDGMYRVRYAEKDMAAMERIRADVAVALYGPAKELYAEQLRWTDRYETAAMNAIISGKYPDGSLVQEGSALVGSDGKSVEITRQYIKLYQGDTVKRISRNASGDDMDRNIREVSLFVKGMEEPVFLDKDGYRNIQELPTEERGDFLSTVQRAGLLLPTQVYKEKIMQTAMNDRSPDGGRFHAGDMIADSRGSVIEVKEKNIVIKETGKAPLSFARRSEEARNAIREVLGEMSRPVYLNASKAMEYNQLSKDDALKFARAEEKSAREFVESRHIITADEMRAIAQAEAMRHTIEVRLQAEGVELPKTETMTYNDAANVFGLRNAEVEEFSHIVQTGVTAPASETKMDDVLDNVMDRFVGSEPHATQISDFERWGEERTYEDMGLDTQTQSEMFDAFESDVLIDDALSQD